MGNAEVVRVLQSFKEPRAQTNPYITQLRDSLAATDGVEPICFTWKAALTGRYDVFHAHWPESLIERRGRISTFGRRVLYAALLARLRIQRIPIVRTVHNIDLPQGISRFDVKLLKETDRLTTMRIVLNGFTPVPPGASHVLIEHGHYRDWFARYPRPETVPGRFAFFGKIRRYKNADGLLRAFTGLPASDGSWTLRVVGAPSSREVGEGLSALADKDPRITLSLGHADDEHLVREVSEAGVVVLPYPEMHNSGSVLAALSLDRPVLVPDNEFNRALDAEMGEGWVLRYSGDLEARHLLWAATEAAGRAPDDRPDMSRRNWSDTGRRHLDAYRRAMHR